MKAIQAGSSWVANHFHMKDVGSIAVGKYADIVILTADPTKDVMNLRKIDTVMKDGKVIDRSYHAWYRGDMFSNSHDSYDRDVVDISWEQGLKAATVKGADPAPASAAAAAQALAANGGTAKAAAAPLGGGGRRGGGAGTAVLDPNFSPTPGIEDIYPHTVIQGSGDTTFTLTGINFVKRSVVYIDGQPVPTNVTARNVITFVADANTLNKAGKIRVTVKSPAPLVQPEWGDTSNTAYVLVPFSFTTAWSHNKDVLDFQK